MNATRLRHASGANVDEPHLEVLLQLTYEDGEWGLQRAWLEDGQLRTAAADPTEIPFELAQAITEAAGVITAEVVRRNHVMWAQALEEHELAAWERARQGHTERIGRIHALAERLSGRAS